MSKYLQTFFWNALILILGGIISIALNEFHGPFKKFINGYTNIPNGALVGWFVISIVLTWWALIFHFKRVESLQSKKQKILSHNTHLQRILKSSAEARNMDPLTGLPSYPSYLEKLQSCIKDTGSADQDQPPTKRFHTEISEVIGQDIFYHAAFIDIDEFRDKNLRHEFHGGSVILQELGTRIRKRMRRNEHIYSTVEIPKHFEAAYRVGGDEFAYIIEDDCLGSLLFLERQLRELSEHAEEIGKIIGNPISLTFHAGLTPILTDDNPEAILDRLWKKYRFASDTKQFPLRICWSSFRESDEIEEIPVLDAGVENWLKFLEADVISKINAEIQLVDACEPSDLNNRLKRAAIGQRRGKLGAVKRIFPSLAKPDCVDRVATYFRET